MSRSFKYQGYDIDQESGEKISVLFLRKPKSKQAVQYFFYLISLGILYEVSRWLISFELLQYSPTSQDDATHVLVRTQHNNQKILKIKCLTLPVSVLGAYPRSATAIKYFTFRYIKYYLDPHLGNFKPLEFKTNLTCNEIHRHFEEGVHEIDLQARLKLFGTCLIDVPVPSIASLLIAEASHPFFIFQVLSIILWIAEQYYYYAVTIFVLSMGSLLSTVVEIRKNMKDIRKMALHECEVQVNRGGWQKSRSRYIVPGDIIRVPENAQLPCDMILLQGSCLMDESMLTGESQPILKENLPKHNSAFDGDRKYVLISGTKALTCRGQCIGLVTSTGFHTKKGELVRSILFPKPNRFKFNSDSIKIIGALALLAILGFMISLKTLLDQKVGNLGLFFCCADLITIAVPPALPLAMSAGTAFSISRMKRHGITCISPPAVNSAGRISIICFDKTGTLTEDSMKLKGVWDIKTMAIEDNLNNCQQLLQENLATCHSLTKLNDILIGDPQETAIFEHLGWEFQETDEFRCKVLQGDIEISVLHLYHFSSVTKRMGVVSKKLTDLTLHMKGAPEVILPLCKDVPNSAYTNLLDFSQDGNRVLACAFKPLDFSYSPSTPLEEIENNLIFLGLILLHNPLKAETTGTLQTLIEANIRCVMSTGDALLTAAAVGKACGIIEPDEDLVLGSLKGEEVVWENDQGLQVELDMNKIQSVVATGSLLEYLKRQNSACLGYVLDNGKVFGRMSPTQKVILVELLQRDEILVAMVGDGANDCGALKAADVGLSILKPNSEQSSGEASIAAPFSAEGLPSIILLLREGRAALVTSFQCFKFIIMYSMIQFICINFMYFLKSNLLDLQFLYQDLFMILPLAVFMAYTGPSPRLPPVMPPGALISVPVISSIVGQVILQAVFQIFAYSMLISQDWYMNEDQLYRVAPDIINANNPMPAYENTVLFLITSVQLLIVCVSFSIGPPFRLPAYKNIYFSISILFISVLSIYLIMSPQDTNLKFLQMEDMRMDFRWILLAIVIFGCVVTWIYERFGVPLITTIIKK